MPAEQVLCVPRSRLPPAWLPVAGVVPLAWAGLRNGLCAVAPEWSERAAAEIDPRLKQWIPYAVICRPDGAVAAYPRRGAEARLHGLWSVGVGGHANPDDLVPGAAWDWPAVLEQALRRELAEEVDGVSPAAALDCLGVVNEERSPVGRVHIGLVCRLPVTAWQRLRPGPELGGLAWLTPADLRQRPLETWSALALDLLA